MSRRRITRVPGQHRVKMIWTVPVVPMTVTAVTLMDVREQRMRDSFRQRYALRLIRLTEYFAQAKLRQPKLSQQESPQRYHLGNANRLVLCPKLHGDSYTNSRRV